MEYQAQIAQAINDFLVNDDWKFRFEEDKNIFRFSCEIKSKLKGVDCIIRVKEDSYMVLAICNLSADDCKAEMAEFITRANYGLNNGNFEMDYNDGEIRYKSYVDCEDSMPSEAIIKNSIYLPIMMFQRYGDGLASVIFGVKTPEQAVADSEADLDD